MPVPSNICRPVERLGFVSTRVAGTDGVSLEIRKWADILEGMGINCFYLTGESDRPADRTALIREAHFTHPRIQEITRQAFAGPFGRTSRLTMEVEELTHVIRTQLVQAIHRFELDALIAQNAVTIPMNIPLGLALVQLVQEENIGCIAHHHDFFWERKRYAVSCVDDYLRVAFPPALRQIQHVVINTPASDEFSRRTGLSCRVIPNVMNFAHPPEPPDAYAATFRQEIGLAPDELLILQPTRVVARKGIEHSIELVRRLNMGPACLVITHESGDEGDGYATRIQELAELMNVRLLFADRWISEHRGQALDGRRLYTIGDAYSQADLVAYPSEYEGFGNAFLEAIYYRCPIVCNRYTIFRTDIEPYGFRVILFDGYLTSEIIEQARKTLRDAEHRQAMVDHNYEVAARFFGYDLVENELRPLLRRAEQVRQLKRQS